MKGYNHDSFFEAHPLLAQSSARVPDGQSNELSHALRRLFEKRKNRRRYLA
jgi:hypothetical protein